MGSSLCSLNTETEEFYYEVTEERGNSVKRAFGRRYFLVVPIPGLRGEEITIEIRTKNLYDASADQISINGMKKDVFLQSRAEVEVGVDGPINFCRNPLKVQQVTKGYERGKVIPFKNDFKIIILPEWIPSGAVKCGTVRVYGSE